MNEIIPNYPTVSELKEQEFFKFNENSIAPYIREIIRKKITTKLTVLLLPRYSEVLTEEMCSDIEYQFNTVLEGAATLIDIDDEGIPKFEIVGNAAMITNLFKDASISDIPVLPYNPENNYNVSCYEIKILDAY